MAQRRAFSIEGRVQGQLLRRELEQLLGKSEEEKHGAESKQEAPVAEPKPTDTKTAKSEPSAAVLKSIAKPKEKPE